MRHKNENSETLQMILNKSFKLFSTKPYEKVTFTEIEKETGLSRGAILYYFKTKEALFDMVMERMVFSKSTILGKKRILGLWNNIDYFLDMLSDVKEKYRLSGIENANLAFLTLESNAFFNTDKMQKFSYVWVNNEISFWKQIIDQAIEDGEIIHDVDSQKLARLIFSIYIGASYSGIANIKGCDINELREEYSLLYNMIKQKDNIR